MKSRPRRRALSAARLGKIDWQMLTGRQAKTRNWRTTRKQNQQQQQNTAQNVHTIFIEFQILYVFDQSLF